ncbi:MAG: nucleotidyltransferase domain-containing protein [Candidatus Caldarchaeum sp.]
MVRHWREYVGVLAEAVRKVLGDADVYVFGSVVTGESVASSDVDVLIVSERVPESMLERGALKVEVERVAELPVYHPFELHIVRPDEAEHYFKKIGRNMLKV